MMADTNCIWYKDGFRLPAKLDIAHIHIAWIESKNEAFLETHRAFNVTIAAPPNDNGKTKIIYPGVHSSYLAIDDSLSDGIPETVYDYTERLRFWYKPWTWLMSPRGIARYKTIYHDVSQWQWRDPDAKCHYCDSINYRAMGHGIYRCNDCDKIFDIPVQAEKVK